MFSYQWCTPYRIFSLKIQSWVKNINYSDKSVSTLPVNWIIALHMLVAMHVGLKIWMSWTIMEFYIFFLNIFIAIHFKTNCGIFSVAMTILCTSKISRWTRGFWGTGKSLSEALIFASTNPQYDDRLFIQLQVQYMKIQTSNLGRTCCVQK